ncbi:zinc finger protein 131-like isoform X1 [Dermacentor variabilis]|uniref:zinc finger protein 131-like isoform X1 n=2 Tax=Dermacentor variabilis TaxID=34621 RepID=UPI003F5BAFA7
MRIELPTRLSLTSRCGLPVTYTYLIPSTPSSPQPWHKEVSPPPMARRDDAGCFTCVSCHKEFSSEYDFVVHQRRHTGERPFQCSRCFESFASASALLLHRGSMHGSRSPFRCTFCGRTFNEGDAYSHHLSRHRRTGFCFRCSCTRLFRDEEEIRAHLAVHESGNGHKCPCCRRVYESLLALGAHFTKHEKAGKTKIMKTPPRRISR